MAEGRDGPKQAAGSICHTSLHHCSGTMQVPDAKLSPLAIKYRFLFHQLQTISLLQVFFL